MLSTGLTIVLAAALRVAIPAFEVERTPGIVAQRLPEQYAAALQEKRCAAPLAPSQFGPQTTNEFLNCAGELNCLSTAARVLGAPYVLLGRVQRLDSHYLIKIGILDVKEQRIAARVEHRHEGKMNEFDTSVRAQIDSLCTAIDPTWTPEKGSQLSAAEDKLTKLAFEVPTAPVAPPPPAPAPLPPPAAKLEPSTDFADLPPLLPDEPEVVAKPAPPPSPKVEAPVVVKAEPPPPAKPAPAKVEAPTPTPTIVATPASAGKAPNLVTPAPSAKPKKFPWATITGAGAVVALGTGIGLGAHAMGMWGNDRPVRVGEATVRSLTAVEAERAKSFALGANVLFAAAGALAITSGVVFVTQGGFGFNGQF